MDILPNLQTGLINAAPLPPSYALAGQVDRVAPNMLDLAWAPLVGALVVSKKTWDAIPPETREAMRQAAVEAGAKMKAEGRRESVESVEAMRKRGLTVHPVDAGGRGPMAARDGDGLSQNPGIHRAGGHFRRGDEPVGHLSRRTAEEMSGAANPVAPAPEGWRRWLRAGEDSLVTLRAGRAGDFAAAGNRAAPIVPQRHQRGDGDPATSDAGDQPAGRHAGRARPPPAFAFDVIPVSQGALAGFCACLQQRRRGGDQRVPLRRRGATGGVGEGGRQHDGLSDSDLDGAIDHADRVSRSSRFGCCGTHPTSGAGGWRRCCWQAALPGSGFIRLSPRSGW